MKQMETFTQQPPDWADGSYIAPWLLGRAVAILEGLVESPTDAIDIQLAEDLLTDYRKWMERES